MLTQERLKEMLHYDPETGDFTWLMNRRRAKFGARAGRIANHGYFSIGVDGKYYLAHRLAWLFVTGSFPPNDIDHKDGDRTNNRFENLREATRGQNRINQPARGGRLGVKGVNLVKRRSSVGYVARIGVGGGYKHLGTFSTLEEAGAAYDAAAKLYHGEFVRAA